MKLNYEVKTEEGKPRITLSCNGEHVGTIWGEVKQNDVSEFNQKRGIIAILQDGKHIASLWNTQPLRNKQINGE